MYVKDGERGIPIRPDIIDEALIASDVFDLNELLALELLLAGRHETPSHLEFGRGLCSVLLFYRHRGFYAKAIRLLIQNRNGRRWVSDLPKEFGTLITNFTEGLVFDGLLSSILDFLRNFSIAKELEKLQRPEVKGIGGPRHLRMVTDEMVEMAASLADSVFFWFCQCNPTKNSFIALTSLLRNIDYDLAEGPRYIQKTVLPLIMAGLEAIDVPAAKEVNLSETVGTENQIFEDPTILNIFFEQIVDSVWKQKQMQAVFQLTLAVTIRLLNQRALTPTVDEDDMFDKSLEQRPFHWLLQNILQEQFFVEEFFIRRMHGLVTQLITFFPTKVNRLPLLASIKRNCGQRKIYR
ncbi:unnamed protein product [Soboliphyme baturini]|uniref:Nuclear pore complex protein n=1 Tax=Soboliphyme baturini TaxID=241478 RepID=A0A183IKN5_9BILA|nr:unnamed protein product [Soboliphyme baturini]